MPMATKLGRVVTHYEEFPSRKSQDLSITFSCEVISQISNVISLLAEDLWALT